VRPELLERLGDHALTARKKVQARSSDLELTFEAGALA